MTQFRLLVVFFFFDSEYFHIFSINDSFKDFSNFFNVKETIFYVFWPLLMNIECMWIFDHHYLILNKKYMFKGIFSLLKGSVLKILLDYGKILLLLITFWQDILKWNFVLVFLLFLWFHISLSLFNTELSLLLNIYIVLWCIQF